MKVVPLGVKNMKYISVKLYDMFYMIVLRSILTEIDWYQEQERKNIIKDIDMEYHKNIGKLI